MTQRQIFSIIGIVTFITLLVLAVGLYSLEATTTSRSNAIMKTAFALRDSLAILQSEIDSLKAQTPGLGEYMTTFQLHMAKLWFAVQASNWGLAQYELGELTETVEAAEALHAVKNNVNTASVLQSVRETQLATLQSSIQKKNTPTFVRAYDQTIQSWKPVHQ